MLMRSFWSISFVLLVLPSVAAAQLFSNTDPYKVSITPQYPAPNEQIILKLVSGSLNLNNAEMAISVNGNQVYKGGAKTTPVRVGGGGVPTTIEIVVTSNGTPYPKTITVRPQDIVLIVEPLASAPALYQGKPLVPLKGASRVVAVANLKDADGSQLDPTKLVYSWAVDETKISGASGIGKEAILVASPLQYRSRNVSVNIQSQDGKFFGGASLALSPEPSAVRIYENDPLLGTLYDRALSGTHNIEGDEKTFMAVPYSFPTKDGPVLLQWFLGGKTAQTGSTITLRPSGSGSGNASLSLVASSGDSAQANHNLSINFGVPSRGFGSIFGL